MGRFPYLVDAPEDGIVEARGWIIASAAPSPEAAAAEFTRLYESPDPPVFTCSGERVWLIAILDDAGESGTTLRGRAAEEFCRANPDYDECVRYGKAAADDPDGAEEWWVIEATPVCDAYDDTDDFYCVLPEGHEGRCSPPSGARE